MDKMSLFYQDQTENPCDAAKIHNLPQNLPMGSFGNALHRCGASVEPHGLFLLICNGIFHTK
jgi:hypothetical protein